MINPLNWAKLLIREGGQNIYRLSYIKGVFQPKLFSREVTDSRQKINCKFGPLLRLWHAIEQCPHYNNIRGVANFTCPWYSHIQSPILLRSPQVQHSSGLDLGHRWRCELTDSTWCSSETSQWHNRKKKLWVKFPFKYAIVTLLSHRKHYMATHMALNKM